MSTPPGVVEDDNWKTEMQNFILNRYARVQTAAQTWLTIMTTLFGLFSTVVVVSGAKTISDIQGGLPWRIGVVAGAGAVFVLALAATGEGLLASWGGLGSLWDDLGGSVVAGHDQARALVPGEDERGSLRQAAVASLPDQPTRMAARVWPWETQLSPRTLSDPI